MTRTGAYGERLGEFLRLEEAPPTLVTRSLRSTELAVTETRNDNPVPGLSGSFAAEDAYLVSLKLRDYPECEIWGRAVTSRRRMSTPGRPICTISRPTRVT